MTTFEQVLGQSAAIGEMREELQRGRVNHAYLLEGAVGSGRLTLARAFAANLLCAEATESCGECKNCRLLAADNHPDYLELPRATDQLSIHRFVERSGCKEKLSHPRVLDFLHLRPVMGGRRLCVIPDAERIRPEAANTFLKTLEEPPGNAVILLTTAARDRLLGTIVSRCRRVRVQPLAQTELVPELMRRTGQSEESAAELGRLAEGSLGMALTLGGEETLENWQWVQGVLKELTPSGALAFATGMVERSERGAKEAKVRRVKALRLLDLAALYLRGRLREGAAPEGTARALAAIWGAGEQILANVQPKLALHAAALEAFSALRRG